MTPHSSKIFFSSQLTKDKILRRDTLEYEYITKIKNLLGVVGVLPMPSLFFLTGIPVPIQGGLLAGTDSLDLDSSGKLSNML